MAYVLRCFEDEDVTHVEGRLNPLADAETVETELMLADLERLERRRIALEKRAKGQDKEAKTALSFVDLALEYVGAGKPARLALDRISESERRAFRQLQLLTSKPVLYICNVDEGSAAAKLAQGATPWAHPSLPAFGGTLLTSIALGESACERRSCSQLLLRRRFCLRQRHQLSRGLRS